MRDTWPICLLFALACSSAAPPAREPGPEAPPPSTAPSITPEQLTAPVGHLVLGPLTVNKDGKPGLVLHQDGTVEVPGERVLGTLKADGRFVSPRGELVAQLTEEGEIVTPDGKYLPVVVEPTGGVKLLKENRVIRLREDGALEGANPAGPVVTIDGATPQTRRAALFLLVLSAYPLPSGS